MRIRAEPNRTVRHVNNKVCKPEIQIVARNKPNIMTVSAIDQLLLFELFIAFFGISGKIFTEGAHFLLFTGNECEEQRTGT